MGEVVPEESPCEVDLKLVAALIATELNRSDAQRFARDVPHVCRRQLAFLPYAPKFKTSRGAYLRRAIEEDFGVPAAVCPPPGFKRSSKKPLKKLFDKGALKNCSPPTTRKPVKATRIAFTARIWSF